jgi:hypothetical protein
LKSFKSRGFYFDEDVFESYFDVFRFTLDCAKVLKVVEEVNLLVSLDDCDIEQSRSIIIIRVFFLFLYHSMDNFFNLQIVIFGFYLHLVALFSVDI